jgi:hypothetical protein
MLCINYAVNIGLDRTFQTQVAVHGYVAIKPKLVQFSRSECPAHFMSGVLYSNLHSFSYIVTKWPIRGVVGHWALRNWRRVQQRRRAPQLHRRQAFQAAAYAVSSSIISSLVVPIASVRMHACTHMRPSLNPWLLCLLLVYIDCAMLGV